MRILYAPAFVPFPPTEGGLLVSHHLVRGLVHRGHELAIAVAARRPGDDERITELSHLLGLRARFWTVRAPERSAAVVALDAILHDSSLRVARHRLPALNAEVARRLAAGEAFDLVFLDSIFTSYLLATARRILPNVPAVVLEHNVESQVVRRLVEQRGSIAWKAFASWEAPRLEAAEREIHRGVDRVLTLSDVDAETIRGQTPEAPTFVLGTGIPTFEGEAIAPPSDPAQVLFLASYRWPPNLDAARWLARSIWPLVRPRVPTATLVLAGGDPSGLVARLASRELGIETPGFVEDASRATRNAAFCVAPLLAGGGVRLKILEALANERAVVTTTLGAEGLGLEPGVHALFADDAKSFADAIARLLSSPGEAGRLARAGRQLVEERFAWPRVHERLETCLAEVVASRGAMA